MATKSQIERRIANLQAQLDNAFEELERVKKLPNLDELVGTGDEDKVIYFQKQFVDGSKWYSYAAIYCWQNGFWYTTGPRSNGPFTTSQMQDFLSSGVQTVFTPDTWESV